MEILEYQGVAPCYYDHTRDLENYLELIRH